MDRAIGSDQPELEPPYRHNPGVQLLWKAKRKTQAVTESSRRVRRDEKRH
jgi:hypothetical protein